MGKKQRPKTPNDTSKPRPRWLTALPHVAMGLGLAAALGMLYRISDQYVATHAGYASGTPKVIITNRPAWMNDYLVQQIEASITPARPHGAGDQEMLADRATILANNPWVDHVTRVERKYGEKPGDTIEVACEWRTPVALARSGLYWWMIDVHGIKLPEKFTDDEVSRVAWAPDGQVNLRKIEGLGQMSPEAGQIWGGNDVQAAIEMVQLLHKQPFAREIETISLSNFAGRLNERAAQIVFKTRYNTEVRWGRPVSGDDFYVEVSPATKLDNLAKVFASYGRLDAGQPWIDVRFDRVIYPESAPQDAAANAQ